MLLEGGLAAPYPPRFSVWSPSLNLLRDLPGGDNCEVLRRDATELTRVLLDPIDLGQDWPAVRAPVSAVILLEPNFGGRSRLRPIGATDMTRLVLPHCGRPEIGGFWIAGVCDMLASATLAVLEVGTLSSAIDALDLFMDRKLAPVSP